MNIKSFVLHITAQQKASTIEGELNNQVYIITRPLDISQSLSLATWDCHNWHMNKVAMVAETAYALVQ